MTLKQDKGKKTLAEIEFDEQLKFYDMALRMAGVATDLPGLTRFMVKTWEKVKVRKGNISMEEVVELQEKYIPAKPRINEPSRQKPNKK